MRIDFLHQNIYGVGGTVRSVVNLANALSHDHDVRIVSVFRRVDVPSLRIDPRVAIHYLVDMRPTGRDRGNPEHNRRSEYVPPAEEYYRQYSRLTDSRILEYLAKVERDVVIGTRPSLNLMVVEFAPDNIVRVTQEHMTHSAIPDSVVRRMRTSYKRADLVTTVTEADRRRVVQSLSIPESRTAVLPNSVPSTRSKPADPRTKTIVAAGRLAPEKRYDLLIKAMAMLKADFPDWQLRLYGDGPLAPSLAGLADDLGVRDRVLFMGRTTDMDSEWVKGSLAVSTSERESFGMSIVESMRRGVPVISTDCPDGPREIIRHGVDGLLTATDDLAALKDAMAGLMSNRALRASLGRAALRNSARFDPDQIAKSFTRMIRDVSPEIPRRGARRSSLRGVLSRIRSSLGAPREAAIDVAAVDPTTLRISSRTAYRWLSSAEFHRVGSEPIPLKELRKRFARNGLIISTRGLPEGTWNLQLTTSRGKCVLIPETIDTRALAGTSSRGGQDRFEWSIPYRNMNNRLGVRAWSRERHADLATVQAVDGHLEISVRLLGEWSRSSLLWKAERADRTLVASGHLQLHGATNGHFSVSASDIASQRLSRDDRLELSLYDSDGVRVQIARLANDIADARRIVTLPTVLVTDGADYHEFHEPGRSNIIAISAQLGASNSLLIRCREAD